MTTKTKKIAKKEKFFYRFQPRSPTPTHTLYQVHASNSTTNLFTKFKQFNLFHKVEQQMLSFVFSEER